MFWLILIGAMVVYGAILSRLRQPFVGLGLSVLGAILAGGLAYAATVYYFKYEYVKPRPTHDMDFGGLGTSLLYGVIFPVASALGGLVLGLMLAFWREDDRLEM
jgi:hypothetical protein